jgi:hypothetical protein
MWIELLKYWLMKVSLVCKVGALEIMVPLTTSILSPSTLYGVKPRLL